MKILHTYCLNHNLGDYALGIGVKNLLRKYLDVDLIAETNIQGTVFNEYYIDNVVNKKYDLLVIGGGGIIHGAHWPNGWFWLIKEELIDRIKIPFVIYGAGYNYFEDEGGIPDIGKRHLLKTIEKAKYFSLRNDKSVQRFQKQIPATVHEVPDPGFHINLDKSYTCSEREPFVLIQLANDKPEHRFGSFENRDYFIDEMRKVTHYISKKYKVIFAPHVFEDVELSKIIADGIENTSVWSFSDYAFDNCKDCLGFYDKAEFVLAMRGHGQIIPIAFNTPIIALENHPKHSGLMRKLNFEEYNVSLKSDNISNKIISTINYLEKNKNIYIDSMKEVNKKLTSWSMSSLLDLKDAIKNSS